MIESTGILTLIADARSGHVAVPDVVSAYANADPDPSEGTLYQKLLELLGQEVYVLVLPKSEMLAMCLCGHIKADHMEFTNWDHDRLSGTDREPDLSLTVSHRSYVGIDPRDDCWCKCRKFEPVLPKEKVSA